MITKTEVRHIAKLARLGLTEKEIQKFQKELAGVLNYAEKLKEVDTGDVMPTIHSQQLKNIVREDRAKEEELAAVRQLVEMAPEKERGYIKVKAVL